MARIKLCWNGQDFLSPLKMQLICLRNCFKEFFPNAAERPFDLENGPLFRVSVFRTDKTKVVLFVFHHIVVDFLSLELVLGELGAVYQALIEREGYNFETNAGHYHDYIQWQRRMLASDRGSGAENVLASATPGGIAGNRAAVLSCTSRCAGLSWGILPVSRSIRLLQSSSADKPERWASVSIQCCWPGLRF